jgi:queuosine precursor transporter
MTLAKENTLFQILCSVFCVIVVISNIISSKMIPLPFLGNLAIPAGLITYPLTFLLSDLATEIFGAKKARLMIYTSLGTALLSLAFIQIALLLPATDEITQVAFEATLGTNGIIIFASLIGYLLAQIIDITLYAQIKYWTGDRWLWLRNNASTLASQVIDTIAVNMIHLYWGIGMDFTAVAQVMLFSYCYKAFFSIANTPLFYLLVYAAKRTQREGDKGIWRDYILRKAGRFSSPKQNAINDLF